MYTTRRQLLAAVAMTTFGAAIGSPQITEVAPGPDHAPSILPAGKTFKLVWHDEFDGDSLDTSKWCYRTNFWGIKAHWFATPEDNAVEVKDGLCRLKLVKRPDGQFASPQLQTGELMWDIPQKRHSCGIWFLPKRENPKFMHRYGYYECRCKLQQLPGWWSAFWMQSPMQGCSLDPGYAGIEHDIMESFEPGKVIPHWFHTNGYGADYLGFCTPRKPKDANIEHNKVNSAKLDKTKFHTFGLLWEPDGYTIYIDGVQHGEKVGVGPDEAVSHTDEFILLTTEAKGYRKNCLTGTGVPELEATAAAGDAFEVDFVRVYDVVANDDKKSITLSYDDSGRASSSGDLLLPRVVDASTPVVLVIHGGGWNAMTRKDLEGVAAFFRDDLST